MELFTTTFQTGLATDSTFTTFQSNNKILLDNIVNSIINEEKMYGTSPRHKDLIFYHTILMYKIVMPYIYTSLGLTWTNATFFTEDEQKQIDLTLRLKSYTI